MAIEILIFRVLDNIILLDSLFTFLYVAFAQNINEDRIDLEFIFI